MISKKILKLVAFTFTSFLLIFCANISMIQGDSVSLRPPITVDPDDPNSAGLSVEGIIGRIAGAIFWLAMMICPIAIIWGGFEIATAGGDQNKITKGKQIITYSIVGLLIIGMSTALAGAIKSALGG